MNKNHSTALSDEYFEKYPENSDLRIIENFFVTFPEGDSMLEAIAGSILRSAIDEVIDMPRTGRFSIDELEKTEKTYIGTKVEIVFRDTFQLQKGSKLDFLIQGIEVDIKNTILNNWTIPLEALDQICILLQTNDNKSIFNFGLLICRDRVLNCGKNRDKKRTVSKKGREEILWLVKNGKLPTNFFLHMAPDIRDSILVPKGGATRLANLFRHYENEIISRRLVECVARQKDYMKRTRRNGGAQDILDKEGLVIYWGGRKADKKIIDSKGYGDINADNFVCFREEI